MLQENENKKKDDGGRKQRIDAAVLEKAFKRFRGEQDMHGAIVSGIAGALMGTCLWVLTIVFTGRPSEGMAMAVGIFTGLAVRAGGRGIDEAFGLAGALLAMAGLAVGILFSIYYLVNTAQPITIWELLTRMGSAGIHNVIRSLFSPLAILFYGFVVYAGYRLSFRIVSEEEVIRASKG